MYVCVDFMIHPINPRGSLKHVSSCELLMVHQQPTLGELQVAFAITTDWGKRISSDIRRPADALLSPPLKTAPEIWILR